MTTPEGRAKDVCRRAGWTIQPWVYDIIVSAIRAAVEESAQIADEWGAGSSGSIPAAEFERRYGHHDSLAAAIRSRKV